MARKRKSGPRTKSGRLSKAYATDPRLRDQGTFEAQAKRRALVGNDADPALSSTAPGSLFACGYIDKEQYAEAMEYRTLRCALYGPPWPTVTSGGEASEERLKKLKERFDRRVRLLSEDQKHVISEVCVFDHRPTWFFARRLGLHLLPEDVLEQELLISGLNALIGAGQKRAA